MSRAYVRVGWLDSTTHLPTRDLAPREVPNAQVRARLGVDTALEKVLLIYGEWQAGRTTVVLVREPVGV